jgi:cyclin D2
MDMDLACNEQISVSNYAPKDPNIFNDFRVMKHLLNDESLYTPHTNYFQNVQTDIEPFMRKVVATWMLEVRFPKVFVGVCSKRGF